MNPNQFAALIEGQVHSWQGAKASPSDMLGVVVKWQEEMQRDDTVKSVKSKSPTQVAQEVLSMIETAAHASQGKRGTVAGAADEAIARLYDTRFGQGAHPANTAMSDDFQTAMRQLQRAHRSDKPEDLSQPIQTLRHAIQSGGKSAKSLIDDAATTLSARIGTGFGAVKAVPVGDPFAMLNETAAILRESAVETADDPQGEKQSASIKAAGFVGVPTKAGWSQKDLTDKFVELLGRVERGVTHGGVDAAQYAEYAEKQAREIKDRQLSTIATSLVYKVQQGQPLHGEDAYLPERRAPILALIASAKRRVQQINAGGKSASKARRRTKAPAMTAQTNGNDLADKLNGLLRGVKRLATGGDKPQETYARAIYQAQQALTAAVAVGKVPNHNKIASALASASQSTGSPRAFRAHLTIAEQELEHAVLSAKQGHFDAPTTASKAAKAQGYDPALAQMVQQVMQSVGAAIQQKQLSVRDLGVDIVKLTHVENAVEAQGDTPLQVALGQSTWMLAQAAHLLGSNPSGAYSVAGNAIKPLRSVVTRLQITRFGKSAKAGEADRQQAEALDNLYHNMLGLTDMPKYRTNPKALAQAMKQLLEGRQGVTSGLGGPMDAKYKQALTLISRASGSGSYPPALHNQIIDLIRSAALLARHSLAKPSGGFHGGLG